MNAPTPGFIGKSVERREDGRFLTGKGQYTDDISLPGQTHAFFLRSPYAHAELLEVDVSEAQKLPGVRCVITGSECDTPYGVIPIAQNEFPLARDRVRYIGEPVAAVAAIDEATAELALSRIRLRVRELPAYFKAADARAVWAGCHNPVWGTDPAKPGAHTQAELDAAVSDTIQAAADREGEARPVRRDDGRGVQAQGLVPGGETRRHGQSIPRRVRT